MNSHALQTSHCAIHLALEIGDETSQPVDYPTHQLAHFQSPINHSPHPKPYPCWCYANSEHPSLYTDHKSRTTRRPDIPHQPHGTGHKVQPLVPSGVLRPYASSGPSKGPPYTISFSIESRTNPNGYPHLMALSIPLI